MRNEKQKTGKSKQALGKERFAGSDEGRQHGTVTGPRGITPDIMMTMMMMMMKTTGK
jgi:hypothetical protein